MPEVDPRFDPQFQRGYDPSKHARPSRPAPAPRAEENPLAEERAEGTRLEAHSERPGDRTPVANGADAPRETPVSDGEVRAGDDLDPPPRNPFRLILLLVSIAALLGAGALLWQRIAQDPYGQYTGYGGDVGRIFVQQLTDALLAPLLTGGLLGLCLWLALGALRRRP